MCKTSKIRFFLTVSMLLPNFVWTRDRTFDDKLSTEGYSLKAGSHLKCTRACSKNSNCTSFFFAPGQDANCQLHENIVTSEAGLLTVPGSMYYSINQASPTTTTTVSVAMTTKTTTVSVDTTTTISTTTPPPFSCPPDDSIFRTVQLEDSSTFTYKVVKENRNQSESAASCQSLGGFLARVTTKAKMDMLLELVSTCIGYYGQDYYVDGSNAAAADFTANAAWVMTNGDLVPMTTDFWDINSPDNPSTEHCLRMKLGSYKWDDCHCGIKFSYICEM